LGHNIETSVFTIIDIYYKPVLNTKGLIQSDPTMEAIRPKVAYYAIQNLASIFDNDLVLKTDFKYTTTTKESMSVCGFQDKITGNQLVALWLDGQNVTNSFKTIPVSITFENVIFKTPVWVDLMTGSIYEIPKAQWSRSGNNCIFNIPLYDSPVLIAEKTNLIK